MEKLKKFYRNKPENFLGSILTVIILLFLLIAVLSKNYLVQIFLFSLSAVFLIIYLYALKKYEKEKEKKQQENDEFFYRLSIILEYKKVQKIVEYEYKKRMDSILDKTKFKYDISYSKKFYITFLKYLTPYLMENEENKYDYSLIAACLVKAILDKNVIIVKNNDPTGEIQRFNNLELAVDSISHIVLTEDSYENYSYNNYLEKTFEEEDLEIEGLDFIKKIIKSAIYDDMENTSIDSLRILFKLKL